MILREKYITSIQNIIKLGKSVFLVGARQVGKTSIMKSLEEFKIFYKKKIIYINIDQIISWNATTFKNPKEFVSYIELYTGNNIEQYDIICLDEVVRIQNINLLLKWLIDKHGKKKQFICSASGNYESVHEVIEWLAGRIIKQNVYPLDFKEFLLFKGQSTNITVFSEKIYQLIQPLILEYLTFWWYPEIALTAWQENKTLLLKSIVDSVFDKDIRKFIKEEKMLDFQNLIHYLANSIGSLLSYEGIAKTLGNKVHDIKKFIDSIQKSYLAFTLHPFFSDKKNEYSQRSKLYFWDFGIMNYILQRLTPKRIIDGKDIEMMVFLNLYYNLQINEKIYFYQKINGSEIDFILQRNNGLLPIESKSSNRDNIPKIFFAFLEKYEKDVQYFIKTTQYKDEERKIQSRKSRKEKKVKILPFWTMGNME